MGAILSDPAITVSGVTNLGLLQANWRSQEAQQRIRSGKLSGSSKYLARLKNLFGVHYTVFFLLKAFLSIDTLVIVVSARFAILMLKTYFIFFSNVNLQKKFGRAWA
jgi:hypothetical protein